MSKKLMVALGVLLLVVLAFVLTRKEPSREPSRAAWSVSGTESLDKLVFRIGVEEYVFEKEDGQWMQTVPVRGKASKTKLEQLEKLFAAGLSSDLAAEKGADLASLGLASDAPRVLEVHAAGALLAKFTVGNEVTVPNTDAKRLWLLPSDGDHAVRALSSVEGVDFPSLLHSELKDLRERTVAMIDRDAVTRLQWSSAGIDVLKQDKPDAKEDAPAYLRSHWVMQKPEEGMAIEQAKISTVLSTISSLQVENFADEVSAEEAGFDGSQLQLTVTTAEQSVTIELGKRVLEGPKPDLAANDPEARFLRIAGEPALYTLRGGAAEGLDLSVAKLRERGLLSFESAALSKVSFGASDDAPFVERAGDDWFVNEAGITAPVDKTQWDPTVSSLAALRASSFVEDGTDSSALAAPEARSVVLQLQNGSVHRLKLAAVTTESGEALAQLDEGPVFLLGKGLVERLSKAPAEYAVTVEAGSESASAQVPDVLAPPAVPVQ
ncbi:MAG: DUF4340 domain-containing protein [Myxococcota bacterium]|jgi:hypothetical protein|nr:DUF4340 domain-containing protein [Myxococcota bacterium]